MLFLFLLQLADALSDARRLEVDQSVVEKIAATDKLATSDVLEATYLIAPKHFKRFAISIGETGTYRINLKSPFFDPYLILRDAKGNLLAEDDDGLVGAQSQIVRILDNRESYLVDACALHGGVGEFEISLLRGAASNLSAQEKEKWLGDARTRASRWREKGLQLLEDDKLDAAKKLFERALEESATRLGEESGETAACRFDLARLLVLQNDFSRANDLLNRAVSIQEKLLGVTNIQTCDSYQELSNLARLRGDFSKAKDLYEKALRGFEHHLSSPGRLGYLVQRKCGEIAFRMRDYGRSRIFLEKCLPLAESYWGGKDETVVLNLTLLGQCYFSDGDWTRAKIHFERALEIQEQTGREDIQTADIRRRLADLHIEEGSYENAERLLNSALDIYQSESSPNDLDAIRTLCLLAKLHLHKGELEPARSFCLRSMSLAKETLGEKNEIVADTYLDLAEIGMEKLDLAEARQSFKSAQQINDLDQSPQARAKRVSILRASGRLSLLEGNYAKAREAYEQSIELSERVFGLSDYSRIYSYIELALLFREMGDLKKAWDLALKAHKTATINVHSLTRSFWEPERHNYAKTQRIVLDLILDLAPKLKSSSATAFASSVSLTWKALISRGMFSTKQRIFQTGSKSSLETLSQLHRVQSRISSLISQGETRDSGFIAQELEELFKSRSKLESIVVRTCGLIENTFLIDEATIRAALPVGSTFVNFIEHRTYLPTVRKSGKVIQKATWGPAQITAWVLNHGSEIPTQIPLGSSAQIEDLASEFLAELVAYKPSSGVLGISPKLSDLNARVLEKLWTPLIAHMKGNLVLISTDGCLGSFPFGVLQQKNGHFLIEDLKIAWMQDASNLKDYAYQKTKTGGNLLVVGGVDFQSSADSGKPNSMDTKSELNVGKREPHTWPKLPATLDEAQVIADIHSQVYPEQPRLFLSENEPTEGRLKSELSRYSFIHIASHGFFNPGRLDSFLDQLQDSGISLNKRNMHRGFLGSLPGLSSGVVCAGANLSTESQGEDGILTSEELTWINLPTCDLVVLSACQTALGSVRAGEGVVGLRSAFLQAGAKTLVGSLWSVGDRSTTEIMKNFYNSLWNEGIDKLDSLRNAQIQLLNQQRRQYSGQSFPYSWGAFILEGDWR